MALNLDKLDSGRRPRKYAALVLVALSLMGAVLGSGLPEAKAEPLRRLALPDLLAPEAAYEEWLPAALAGDGPCQFKIAVLYLQGIGKPRDATVGSNWLRRAASAGYPPAQLVLGALYLEGSGVPRDAQKAAHWLTLAGEADDAQALFLLAGLYNTDLLGTPDGAKAQRLLRQAAALGHVEAILLWQNVVSRNRLKDLTQ